MLSQQQYASPTARPIINSSNPITVQFAFYLFSIVDVNEKSQTFTTRSQTYMVGCRIRYLYIEFFTMHCYVLPVPLSALLEYSTFNLRRVLNQNSPNLLDDNRLPFCTVLLTLLYNINNGEVLMSRIEKMDASYLKLWL